MEAFLRALIEEKGKLPDPATPEQQAAVKPWQAKTVFMLLRVAVTGKKESPPLFDTLELVGGLRVVERLGLAQQKLR